MSLVLGGEFRVENYKIEAGQFESYSLGNGGDVPGVDFDTLCVMNNGMLECGPKAAGSQVFPGFQPSNEVDRFRNSIAGYVGLETQVTDRFLIDVGGRFENYSDFGETFDGKVAARFAISEEVAVRAAISNGFRAPSLNQIWFNNVSTQFVLDPGTNQLVPRRVLTGNNLDPVTKAFGVPNLKEETSINVSGGFTVRPLRALSITADGYYIDINDRIVLTSRFSSTPSDTTDPDIVAFAAQVADILAPFQALGVSEAQFFSNAVDTETYGAEVVANWATNWAEGTLSLTGSYSYAKTEVKNINVAPSIAAEFPGINPGLIENTVFNREEKNRLETALPQHSGILGARYTRDRLSVGLRGNYFGEVLYRPTNPANDEDFGAKVTADVDLGYRIARGVGLVVGANNVFNTFPDKHEKASNYNDGNFPYSRRVTQFGMNGGFYYGKLEFTLN